jgi:hypothetical protein
MVLRGMVGWEETAEFGAISGGDQAPGRVERASLDLRQETARALQPTHPGNYASRGDLRNPREAVVVRIGMGRKASFCSQ